MPPCWGCCQLRKVVFWAGCFDLGSETGCLWCVRVCMPPSQLSAGVRLMPGFLRVTVGQGDKGSNNKTLMTNGWCDIRLMQQKVDDWLILAHPWIKVLSHPLVTLPSWVHPLIFIPFNKLRLSVVQLSIFWHLVAWTFFTFFHSAFCVFDVFSFGSVRFPGWSVFCNLLLPVNI